MHKNKSSAHKPMPFHRLKKTYFIVLALILGGVMASFFIPETPSQNSPAHQGSLNIEEAVDSRGVAELSGQWLFYWEKLVFPGDEHIQDDGFYEMPKTWDIEQEQQQARTGQGFASFKLQLKNLPPEVHWAILIPEQTTAFQLFVDSKLVASGGAVSATKENAAAYSGNTLVNIGHLHKSTELILQVSNFHHNSGGPWQALQLGPYTELTQQNLKSSYKSNLAVTLASLTCLFLFFQWKINRRDTHILQLTSFAFAILIRLGISDTQPLYALTGHPPWWLHIHLVYLSTLALAPLVLNWLQFIYPEDFNARLTRLINSAFAVFAVLVFCLNPLTFTALLPIIQLLLVGTMAYAIICIFSVVKNKRPGGLSICTGAAIFCLLAVHDILLSAQWIKDSTHLMPLAFVAFLVCLMVNLIHFRAMERLEVKALSKKLLLINQNLERHVKERTQELAEKAAALEHANNKLQVLANTDELSQLLNRRAFLDECSNYAESEPQAAIALLDIDHFKKFNDTYGHAIGDEIIIRLSKALSNCTRPSDLVARFGGEEFLVLLKNTDEAKLRQHCQLIIDEVGKIDLQDCCSVNTNISVSIGGAHGTLRPDSIYRFIQKADEAMYKVKMNGRNNFHVQGAYGDWRTVDAALDLCEPDRMKNKSRKSTPQTGYLP